MLERQSRSVIPESQGTVVRTREHNALLIDAESIDDCLMTDEVVHENAFRAFPLLDVVSSGTGTRETVLGGVNSKSANRFFMVGQGGHALARSKIP